MKTTLAAVAVAGLLTWQAPAQVLPPGSVSVQSQSGQFTVYGVRRRDSEAPVSPLATNAQFLQLEPALLVVSCERIKQTLARELGATAPWRGRVQVRLHAAPGADAPIELSAEQFREGWSYRLHLPEVVERHRLMRAVVEVLLLELANRQAVGRSAEIPAWLAVGLAEHVLASGEAELLFPPPQWNVRGVLLNPAVAVGRRRDPLTVAHARLREEPPRTWQQLSWPTEQDFAGDSAEVYRGSAQLLVTELLRLRDGSACLCGFVEALSQHLNWQTAFLKAFRPHFESLLDVEKWWALQTVHFTGRDLTQVWPYDESWRKLEEALRTPVQVRVATNDLPLRTQVAAQTIIQEWDQARQAQALRSRLLQLDLLRGRLAEELLPLLDDYRQVLSRYLEQRDRAGVVPAGSGAPRGARQLARETIRQLDVLDAKLASLRLRHATPAVGGIPAPPRGKP